MVRGTLSVAIKLFRRLSRFLLRFRFDKIPFYFDIYLFILGVLLPRGKREISVNGCRMAVKLKGEKSFDIAGVALLFEGKYEPQATRCFVELVKPKMRVVDVGANIGYYTLLAAKLIGDGGKVWAFEPESENFDSLSANVRLNGFRNVELCRKAVDDKDGRARLYLSKDSGSHSLVVNWRKSNKRATVVEIVRLDSIVKEKVDIIKTDTEGNEIAVLRGAEKLLNSNRDIKLFVEIMFRPVVLGYIDELEGVLSGYGFDYLYLLDDMAMKNRRVTLQELKQSDWGHKYTPNVLCSRNEIRGIGSI